jgi:hypothetical protein
MDSLIKYFSDLGQAAAMAEPFTALAITVGKIAIIVLLIILVLDILAEITEVGIMRLLMSVDSNAPDLDDLPREMTYRQFLEEYIDGSEGLATLMDEMYWETGGYDHAMLISYLEIQAEDRYGIQLYDPDSLAEETGYEIYKYTEKGLS